MAHRSEEDEEGMAVGHIASAVKKWEEMKTVLKLTVSFLVNLGLKVLEWSHLKVHLLEKSRVYQGHSINHYTVKGRKEERKWKKEGKKKYYWSLDSPVAAI